jgi:hypothetical protein
MRYLLAALVLCSVALAQNPAAPSSGHAATLKPASPKSAPKSHAALQPRPDDGSITGDTYTENFFNLSCAIPAGWSVKTAAMREGLAGQENSILLLSSFAQESPAAGKVNSSLTITAESIAVYPGMKTTGDYFAALSDIVTAKGFTILNEPAEIELGGITFLRGDFKKEDGGTTAYQATMVALRKGYILGITAISGNEEELTPLLNRVHVFAPPTLKKP